MMNGFVNWLLSLSPQGAGFFAIYSMLIQTTVYLSVTAVLIILFKLIFRNRMRAKWHFLIWSILLVRLLVPVFPSSPVSVFNTIKVEDSVIESSSGILRMSKPDTDTVSRHTSKRAEPAEIEQPPKPAELTHTEESVPQSFVDVIYVDRIVVSVWAGGVLLLLGYLLTVFCVYRHRLKKRRSPADESALAVLSDCTQRINTKRKVRLFFADTTPTLTGLFKPAIYISSDLNESELEATLLHELSHMKHFDILWSAIAAVVLCLNWFNPIIWLCFFIFKRDVELYCDERTLRYTGDRQSYALLLLNTSTGKRYVFGTTSLSSGKSDVKRRIRYLAKFKKPRVIITALAVLAAVIIGALCLTNASKSETTDEKISNPVSESDDTKLTEYVSLYNQTPEMYLENAKQFNYVFGTEIDEGEFGRLVDALPYMTDYDYGMVFDNAAILDIDNDDTAELVKWNYTGSGIARFDITAYKAVKYKAVKGKLHEYTFGTISTTDGETGMAVATSDKVELANDGKALIVRNGDKTVRVTIDRLKTVFTPVNASVYNTEIVGVSIEQSDPFSVYHIYDYPNGKLMNDLEELNNESVSDEKLPDDAFAYDYEIFVRFKGSNRSYSLGFIAEDDGKYWLCSEIDRSTDLYGKPIKADSEVISVIVNHDKGTYVDFGESELYSYDDFDEAVQTVIEDFNSFGKDYGKIGGVGTLYRLTYLGDDFSKKELAYCNTLREKGEPEYKQCIVFGSLFHTDKDVGAAWVPDEDYTWSWHLARTKGGKWKVVTVGY